MSDAPASPAPRPKATAADASVAARGFAWVTGRFARWIVILAWVAAIVATVSFDLPGKLADAETNEPRNYLPSDAESTTALERVGEIRPEENIPLVAVVRRDGGLTRADQAAIKAQIDAFNRTAPDAELPVRDADVASGEPTPTVTLRDAERGPGGEYLAVGDVSRDGTTVLIAGAVVSNDDSDRLLDSIDALRSGLLPLRDEGLTMKVTGGAGFSYDAVKVFGNLNASLAGAAFGLVIILLILIYRSPSLLFLPLIAVGFAEFTSRGVGALTTDIGVTVTGQSSAILSILVLGAGTDYALLVTSRYREELRHHENRHDALRLAMASAGPAVFASGLTVVAGLLTLTVASVEGTAGLGPIGAIGVAVAMLSMLTLLPAMFAVFPRGVFWPLLPIPDAFVADPPRSWVWRHTIALRRVLAAPIPGFVRRVFRTRFVTQGADATHGFWRRTGDRIAVRPRRTWIATGLLLLVGVAGLSVFNPNLSQNDTFIGEVESVDGGELLAEAFPSGATSPATVIVPEQAEVEPVLAALRDSPDIGAAEVTGQAKGLTLIEAIQTRDPYSLEAQERIPAIREAVKRAGGDAVLVGGDTAVNADLAKANGRDLLVIIPIVLAVVLLILIGLLRSLLLPVLLIGTVVLSFAAALGISSVIWDVGFGFAGADRSIIIFAFVFLVALGIDYNIFLASRIREESLVHGTREGILRGIGATGGVITAAGIVLAGTFLVLATTPVVFLVETGTAIAIGVLLDTFIVRSILAPALALDIGRAIWWPWTAKIPEDAAAPKPAAGDGGPEPSAGEPTVSPGLSPNG